MKFLLASFWVFCLFNLVFSLTCYQCDFSKGDDLACDHPKQIVCNEGQEMCLKVLVSRDGIKGVTKTCTPKGTPTNNSTNIFGVETKYSCCQGNLCNRSESVSLDKILLSLLCVYATLKLVM